MEVKGCMRCKYQHKNTVGGGYNFQKHERIPFSDQKNLHMATFPLS